MPSVSRVRRRAGRILFRPPFDGALFMPISFHSSAGRGQDHAPPLARRPPLFGQKGRRDVCINLARIFKLMMLNGRTKNTKYACRMQATVSSCGSVCVRNVHHNCTAMIHTLAQHGDIHKPKTEPKAKGFRAGQKPNQRTNGQQNILAEKESELAAKGTFWGFSNTNLGIHCNKRLNLNW